MSPKKLLLLIAGSAAGLRYLFCRANNLSCDEYSISLHVKQYLETLFILAGQLSVVKAHAAPVACPAGKSYGCYSYYQPHQD